MGQVPSTTGAIGRLVTVSVMVLKRLDGEQINVGPVQRSCGSLDYCLVPAEGAVSMNTCHFLSHVGPTSKMEKVRHSRLTDPSRELFVYLAVFVKVDEAKVPKWGGSGSGCGSGSGVARTGGVCFRAYD